MKHIIATTVTIILLSLLISNVQAQAFDKHKTRMLTNNKSLHTASVVVVPKRRVNRRVIVVKPRPRFYVGYGHHHSHNDAWRWIAFTAITLNLLDNLNEQAQREHEAAQVKATSANVGEKIVWETPNATGFVVATKQGKDINNRTCREFQQQVVVDGKTENAYGRACLRADGSWEIIDTAKVQ